MILTVTPNPALDITYPVPHLVAGQVHRVETPLVNPGGKGINTARVLAALGEDVTATGIIGGSSGTEIYETLKERGLHTCFVHSEILTRRAVIVTDPDNDATVFNEAGQPQSEESWKQLIEVISEHSHADVITINGSFPPQTDDTVIRDVYGAALSTNATVIVDTSGQALQLALEAGVHVVKPNHHELAELCGTLDIDAAISMLLESISLVVCSRGDNGMIASTRGGTTISLPVPKHLSGNPTGAGDSVVASLARSIRTDGLQAAENPRVLNRWVKDALALAGATVVTPVAGTFDPETFKYLRTL